MFEVSKQLLDSLKRALEPAWQPAMEGPQIYYACGGSSCYGTCTNTCKGTCKGSCKAGCTRSCKGHSR